MARTIFIQIKNVFHIQKINSISMFDLNKNKP